MIKSKFFPRVVVTWWWCHAGVVKHKGGTVTNLIFEVIQILKQVILLNQAQFADEQNVDVCLYCATCIHDLGIFSVKSVNFRHFECDVIVFQMSIFDWNLTEGTYFFEYFPYMYGYTALR